MLLKGRVAFVTGAGSGIGKAAAIALAREGAFVSPLDLEQDEVDATCREVEGHGAQCLPLSADVSDPAQMEESLKAIEKRWGRLDIVFANAGINGVWAPIADLQPQEWDQTFAVNMRGTFLTLKYSLPMLKRHGGSVIINSSINGTRVFSTAGASAYASSKAAQVAFAKMAALELAKFKIRVNVICPGAVKTDIEASTKRRKIEEAAEPVEFPEGRIPLTDDRSGTPEEIADLVLFLASDASRHITGTEIWIDAGQSLLQG